MDTVVHLCCGPPSLTIARAAKVGAKRAPAAIQFEMHSFCGPMPLGKKGNGVTLAPSHWFWHAVSQWAQQGEKVDDLRRCIYDPSVPLR